MHRCRWRPVRFWHWAVAGIAVAGGQSLLEFVNIATVRKVTAVVLAGLAAGSIWAALR